MPRITPLVGGDEKAEFADFGILRQAKTAPCGDEHDSRRTRTDHGGSQEGEWVYTGPTPGAKMEMLAQTVVDPLQQSSTDNRQEACGDTVRGGVGTRDSAC